MNNRDELDWLGNVRCGMNKEVLDWLGNVRCGMNNREV